MSFRDSNRNHSELKQRSASVGWSREADQSIYNLDNSHSGAYRELRSPKNTKEEISEEMIKVVMCQKRPMTNQI